MTLRIVSSAVSDLNLRLDRKFSLLNNLRLEGCGESEV